MPVMEWKATYSLNIDSVDRQHKKLISLINYLHDARLAGNNGGTVSKALQELVDYTKSHFSYEEDLFRKHGFAGSNQHKIEHDLFIEKVASYQSRFSTNQASVSLTEISIFLKNWLEKHIMGSDKKYAPFLIEKGVK